MTDVELVIVDDADAAAREAADRLVTAARLGAEIGLSGGSTPRRAYELAAFHEPSWGRAGLWWADERCVPPTDERSNYRLVRETLLDRLASLPMVHRIRGELEPEEAASEYDEELRDGRLDLVLLGIGPDGHTASLFPGSPALDERDRLAVAAEAVLEPFVPRVTLTIPALAAAARVVFLVVGDDKAEAAALAFRDGSPEVPASRVRSADGRTEAILDRSAARLLRS